jgi:hypothetical protein
MQTKPIYIGFAAAILILVIAAAAFTFGLYLGQRGYVADLQYQMPQNVQGQQPADNASQTGPQAGSASQANQNSQNGVGPIPAGGPPGAPSWPPDLTGRLVALSDTSITLDSPQGQVTVSVNPSTKFIDEMGNVLAPTDLRAGDVIAVFGVDTATTLMRLPQRPNAP